MKHFVILLSTLTIVACHGNDPTNRESNPFPESFVADQESSELKVEEQELLPQLFFVTAEGQVESTQILHFVAGSTKSYKINGRSMVDQTSFDLQALNLPEGATLKPDGNGQWDLTWTPSVNIIPEGQKGVDFDTEIEFKVLETTSPRAKYAFSTAYKKTPFRLTVRHSNEQPTIEPSKEIFNLETVREAQGSISFSIIVTDPASNGSLAPKFLREFDSGSSRQTALPAGFALSRGTSAPKYLGDGRWEVPFTLNLAMITNYYKSKGENKKTLQLSFELLAQSQHTKNQSPVWVKTIGLELNSEAN